MLQWAADMAAGWKACTKKLSALSRQLSVGSKAPLVRAGPFYYGRCLRGDSRARPGSSCSSANIWEGHDFSRAIPALIYAASAAGGHASNLNPGNAEL